MPPKDKSRRRGTKHDGGEKNSNDAAQQAKETNAKRPLTQTQSRTATDDKAVALGLPSPGVPYQCKQRCRSPQGDGSRRSHRSDRHGRRAKASGTGTNHTANSLAQASVSPAEYESKGNCMTGNRRAVSRAIRSRFPPSMSNYVMTLRQFCERFRLDAAHVVEEATLWLGMKEVTDDAKGAVHMQPLELTSKALSVAPPNEQYNVPVVPSTYLLLSAVTRLGVLLSAEARRPRRATGTYGTITDEGLLSVYTLRELTLLCKLITWYCIQTAAEKGIFLPGCGSLGASSQCSSARTSSNAFAGRRKGEDSSVAAAHHATHVYPLTSGSAGTDLHGDNSDIADIQDWLGGRMAAAKTTAVKLPDNQLAEQLLRPTIEAVSRFSTYDICTNDADLGGSCPKSDDRDSDHNDGNTEGERMQPQTKGPDNLPTGNEAVAAAAELRICTLAAFCAVLHRFPDADFHATAFLPLLFPNEDARAGPHVRHPLLTPLLWDSSPTSRSVAALLLIALLYKLQHGLQFSEEPRYNHQSFVSLAVQGGAALAAIHDALYWALSYSSDRCSMPGRRFAQGQKGRTCQALPPFFFAHQTPSRAGSDAPLWYNVFSALSIVTPYHRCPISLQVMLQTLDSQILRLHLRDEGGMPFIAATAFLSNVFKNESLRERISERFKIQASASLHKNSDRTACESDAQGGIFCRNFLIDDLLVHASDRVEVWRCLVHIARFYPSLIQQYFEPLLQASCDAVHALLRQETATKQIHHELESALQSARGELRPHRIAAAETAILPLKTPLHCNPAVLPVTSAPSKSRSLGGCLGASRFASPEAFAECLRAWTHFMGYAWKAFDNNPGDPALRTANHEDRATMGQKVSILGQIIMPAMQLESNDEVRIVTLRCLAQIGGNCLASDEVSSTQREQLVRYTLAATQHSNSLVRSESFTTLGVWMWQYSVLDSHSPVFLVTSLSALSQDSCAIVRAKATFAVSNLASRLDKAESLIRDSVEHMDRLVLAAIHAVADSDPTAQGHGIRIINSLLQVLTLEELAAGLPDLSGRSRESVARGFLHTLLGFFGQSWREAKHRWNAAYALGTGLSRTVVFEAEPYYSLQAIETLMTVVVRDEIFKVRTQAANALAKISPDCLRGLYGPAELIPRVVRTLCVALVNARTTESFLQFSEQAALQEALRAALGVMITTAASSMELDKVFAEYRQVLVTENLI